MIYSSVLTQHVSKEKCKKWEGVEIQHNIKMSDILVNYRIYRDSHQLCHIGKSFFPRLKLSPYRFQMLSQTDKLLFSIVLNLITFNVLGHLLSLDTADGPNDLVVDFSDDSESDEIFDDIIDGACFSHLENVQGLSDDGR